MLPPTYHWNRFPNYICWTHRWLFSQKEENRIPLTAQALALSSSQERWNGIFLKTRCGLFVSRTSDWLMEAFFLSSDLSLRRWPLETAKIITGARPVRQKWVPQEIWFFHDVPRHQSLCPRRGRRKKISMELKLGGEVSAWIDVEKPPHVSPRSRR